MVFDGRPVISVTKFVFVFVRFRLSKKVLRHPRKYFVSTVSYFRKWFSMGRRLFLILNLFMFLFNVKPTVIQKKVA
jgi:hypothetical protein